MKIKITKDCSIEVISHIDGEGNIMDSTYEDFLKGETHKVEKIKQFDENNPFLGVRFENGEVAYIAKGLWEETA